MKDQHRPNEVNSRASEEHFKQIFPSFKRICSNNAKKRRNAKWLSWKAFLQKNYKSKQKKKRERTTTIATTDSITMAPFQSPIPLHGTYVWKDKTLIVRLRCLVMTSTCNEQTWYIIRSIFSPLSRHFSYFFYDLLFLLFLFLIFVTFCVSL